MSWYKSLVDTKFSAVLKAFQPFRFGVKLKNTYRFECRDAEGNLLWVDGFTNLTTTQGLNDLLSKYFKGSAYTAAWFVGLVDNAGFSAFAGTDTAAQIGGTNGWAESAAYSESVRQTLTLGSASAGSIDNTASQAVFTMNASGTLKGGFVASSSTKSGTSGILYGEGAFSSTQAFSSGNTISVTVTLTAVTA
jgi:hypothetical protein